MIHAGFILILGFILLVKGADWFVDGAASAAERLGIPQLVVGLTIVAMGTSMPEAAVSIASALKDNPEIAVGNVVGSNILNILMILGITSLIRPIRIQKSTVCYEMPFMILITVLLFVFGITGSKITRIEGGIFWILFLLYFVYLFMLSRKQKADKDDSAKSMDKKEAASEDLKADEADQKKKKIRNSMVFLLLEIVVGGVMVVFGSDLVVDGATVLAGLMGMSDRMIALTVVAFGTSLPELVTSITAARKGSADIAIGNVVGSNIFNILMIIGTVALLRPIPFSAAFYMDMTAAIISALVLLAGSIPSRKLGRGIGAGMLLLYAGYFALLCR